MQTVSITVTCKQGFKYRPCASLMWRAGTHTIHVVEKPKPIPRDDDGEMIFPVEVSPEQLESLRADKPYIVVEGASAGEDVAALKAKIAALQSEVEGLTAHLESVTKPQRKG